MRLGFNARKRSALSTFTLGDIHCHAAVVCVPNLLWQRLLACSQFTGKECNLFECFILQNA
jgi:hypothetical protein